MTISTRGTKGFLIWAQRNMPRMYQDLKKELNTSAKLGGLGDVNPVATATETAPSSSLVDTIKSIAQVAGQVYLTREQMQAQSRILDVQLQRAQQGLAPLDINAAQYGIPQPSIGVSFDDGTKKLMIAGGIGLMLALMFGLIGGGRASRSR